MVISSKYNDYLVYPNESIDKLTVNRVLSRLYSLIGDISKGDTDIVVTNATSSTYGTVMRSDKKDYQYRISNQTEYYYKTLNIEQLLYYANDVYKFGEMSDLVRLDSESNPARAIRMHIGDCSYLNMPNGMNLMVLSFDIGVNNLTKVFSPSITSASVDTPLSVGGYDVELPLDSVSLNTIDAVYGDAESHPITSLFGNLSSNALSSHYLNQINASIHHHSCNYLSYQSYHRSCIELTFSVEMSINELYSSFYGFKCETTVKNDYTRTMRTTSDEFPKETKPFQSKPVIIPQLAFYNTESSPKATFGTYDTETFEGGDTGELGDIIVSASDSVNDGSVSHEISPFDGFVLLKSFDSTYRKNGEILDNVVSFDVVMRFMAGGPDDCNLDAVMRNISARACVQLMLIGV